MTLSFTEMLFYRDVVTDVIDNITSFCQYIMEKIDAPASSILFFFYVFYIIVFLS